MNLKLYTRPFSGNSLKVSKAVSIQSPSALSSRYLIGSSDLFSSETARQQTFTSPDIYPEESIKNYEETQKLPEDSLYKIHFPFPERPKTSHLSGLTLKENQRNSVQSKTLTKIYQKNSARLFSASHPFNLPSDQDFSKILTKLEMVSSNRTAGTRRILINEGDNTEIMLEAGVIQYFIVNSKGKKPPMIGFVKVAKGKVITYASKIHSEPSKDICEVASKAEVFQVKDISVRFRNEVIYIAVEAFADSVFTISISFGQNITMKMRKSLRIAHEEKELTKKPECEFIFKKKKKVVFEKDFVQLNIEKSKKRLAKDALKSNWEFKKDSAQKRKKLIFQLKKDRTLSLLNRNFKTLENFYKVPEEIKRFWVSLLIFQKSVGFFNTLRKKL